VNSHSSIPRTVSAVHRITIKSNFVRRDLPTEFGFLQEDQIWSLVFDENLEFMPLVQEAIDVEAGNPQFSNVSFDFHFGPLHVVSNFCSSIHLWS
jgi:hypothetical protein